MKKTFYYEDITLLRGFAIFLIVYEHMLGSTLFKVDVHTSWASLIQLYFSFIFGASWYFVFISGFLFHGLFYKRGFIYKKFIFDKFKKVFCPYLIFAFIYTLILLFHYKLPLKIATIDKALFYGPFWYVPFIMTMFIFSGFFIKYIDYDIKLQLSILAIAIAASVIFGRSQTNPLTQCIHFTCAYLLGIICSQHYDYFIGYSKNAIISICFILLLFLDCLIAFHLIGEPSTPRWKMFFLNPASPIIVAKLMYCLIFLWCFHKLLNHNSYIITKIKATLNLFAKYAFTIFFIHAFPMTIILNSRSGIAVLKNYSYLELFVFSFLGSIALCFIIILISAPIKKILGKYSRMVIGS